MSGNLVPLICVMPAVLGVAVALLADGNLVQGMINLNGGNGNADEHLVILTSSLERSLQLLSSLCRFNREP